MSSAVEPLPRATHDRVWPWALGLWAVFAAIVLTRGLLFGHVASDSCSYLQLAQQLLDGRGFRQPALGKPDQWFAVWPVGYPLLIFGAAKLTGLPVLLASKLVNIMLAGVNLGLLRILLGRGFRPWAALLLLAPMLEISSYTWSEVPFITGMLWFSAALHRFMLQDRALPLHAASLAAAVLFMFLTRYIGAFGGIVLGLVALRSVWHRDWRRLGGSVAAAAVVTVFVLAYLAHNRAEVGLATGMPRVPAPESVGALAWMTVKAFAKQLNFLVAVFDIDSPLGLSWAALSALALVFTAAWVWRQARSSARNPDARSAAVPTAAWLSLAVVGMLYWAAITSMRWLTHFDRLSLRLLFPGTLLILLAFVVWAQRRGGGLSAALERATLPLVALSVAGVLLADVQRAADGRAPWPWAREEARVLAEAEQIPHAAVVVFGPEPLAYLRSDLLLVRPRAYPLFAHKQDWADFRAELARGAAGRPVYIYVEQGLDPARFHYTVIEAMANFGGQRIVRLSP